jgi:hypothetical protein
MPPEHWHHEGHQEERCVQRHGGAGIAQPFEEWKHYQLARHFEEAIRQGRCLSSQRSYPNCKFVIQVTDADVLVPADQS